MKLCACLAFEFGSVKRVRFFGCFGLRGLVQYGGMVGGGGHALNSSGVAGAGTVQVDYAAP